MTDESPPIRRTSGPSSSSGASAQHAIIGVGNDRAASWSGPTRHPEAQWFGAAGRGLFIHWGLSSVSGCVDLSWGMMRDTTWDARHENRNKLTPNEYWALASRFSPSQYDPERWLAAVARAGFRYAVLTTKHHDGYTLWPSDHSALGTHTHMHGRDLVQPFVTACRNVGLRCGLYFSPPDWHLRRDFMSFGFPSMKRMQDEYPQLRQVQGLGLDHEQKVIFAEPKEHDQWVADQIAGQIEELLSRYGPIDLLWFDGKASIGRETRTMTIERLRQLQPHIVVNDRLTGSGDFQTFEFKLPEDKPTGWWECCWSWSQGGWGYMRDERYAATRQMTDLLASTRSMGGNLLLNVAPRPDGSLPDIAYERIAEFGREDQLIEDLHG